MISRTPGITIGQRTAASFQSLPPLTKDMAAYWTAGHGAYTDAGETLAADAETVQQWDTRIGSLSLSQATLASRPLLDSDGIGGQPALVFDGVDDYLTRDNIPEISISLAYTIMLVFRTGLSVTDSQVILANHNASADRMSIYIREGTLRFADWNGTSYFNPKSGSVSADTNYIGLFSFDGSEERVARLNGVDLTGSLPANIQSQTGLLRVGMSTTNILPFGGRISEIIIYNRALTPAEIAAQESYLAAKYGITLST